MTVVAHCMNCGRDLHSNDMCICPSCGSTTCSQCAKESNALCPSCCEKMRYIN